MDRKSRYVCLFLSYNRPIFSFLDYISFCLFICIGAIFYFLSFPSFFSVVHFYHRKLWMPILNYAHLLSLRQILQDECCLILSMVLRSTLPKVDERHSYPVRERLFGPFVCKTGQSKRTLKGEEGRKKKTGGLTMRTKRLMHYSHEKKLLYNEKCSTDYGAYCEKAWWKGL